MDVCILGPRCPQAWCGVDLSRALVCHIEGAFVVDGRGVAAWVGHIELCPGSIRAIGNAHAPANPQRVHTLPVLVEDHKGRVFAAVGGNIWA